MKKSKLLKSNSSNSKEINARQFVQSQYRKIRKLILNQQEEDRQIHYANSIKKSFFVYFCNLLRTTNICWKNYFI
jgi:hypothetical protein